MKQPDNQWLMSEVSQLQEGLTLPSINCNLLVSDIYDKVELTIV